MLRQILLAGAAGAVLCGAASAADLPRRAAPPVFIPVPVFTWTGAYFGINAGYAFSDNGNIRTSGNNGLLAGPILPLANGGAGSNTVLNVTQERRASSLKSEQEGFTGGGQVGYNYQFTPGSGIVVGLEADAQYTDLSRTINYRSPPQAANGGVPDPSTLSQGIDYIGTVRGRIGYAFDRLLVYGTGGFAYGNVNYNAQFFSNNVAAGNPLAYSGRYSQIETGYVYGGGIEFAIPTDSFLNFFKSNAVTIKAEYLRYDLGSRNVLVSSTNPATGGQFVAAANGSYTSRFSTEGSLVRAGINYKFGSY